ncbi:MAG: ATP-grasp domain-containing protein [Acidobacteriia bacterium]|nr:ATP-grasp domain-containing protein [Terriglobia bacterium]
MRTRILISGAGPATFGILKGLRYSGEAFQCSIVEVQPWAAGNYVVDRFFVIPPVGKDPQEYVNRILRISRREKIDLVIPTVSEELLPLAERRHEFEEQGIRVMVSNPAAIAVTVDKWKTYQFCQAEGIRCPRTGLVQGKDSVGAFARRMGFPISLKPRWGRGSAGFHVVRDMKVLKTLNPVHSTIMQEYIGGMEYSTDVLMQDGIPVLAVPRERLRTESGISVIGKTVRLPKVSKFAINICEALGLEGVANVQIKLDRGGPTLIEVNPRFAGTTILSVAAGVNFPYLAVKNFLRGERFVPSELRFRPNVMLTRFWADIFLEKHGSRWKAFEPDRA